MPTTIEPGRAKRHRHTFTVLWWNFGRYGRQDVHVHDCWDREEGCARVLVGAGRDCEPGAEHHRETL